MSTTKVTDSMRDVTVVDAAKITTGAVPASALSNVDLVSIKQDILTLALHSSVTDNKAAYNLPFSFIDQFEDDTGLTTQTNVDRNSSGEYVSPTIGDALDSYTKLLLHMDDAGLTDSSSTGHTMTASGGAARSSTQSKFGGYSLYCDGTGDWLQPPDHADWDMGTGDYTMEAWVYATVINSTYRCFIGSGNWGGPDYDWLFDCRGTSTSSYHNSVRFALYNGSSNPGIQTTTVVAVNTWTHMAVVRNGSTTTVYMGGVASGNFSGSEAVNSAGAIYIGARGPEGGGSVAEPWVGYIDEVRISKGIARWTSNFSVPTAAYGQTVNATGTLISDTQTAPTATTKMSGVILYKDNAGTATLGTDLVISLSANGGTNYTEAASYGAVTPLFSAGIKMARLGETTVTSGTAPVIKAVWANQASGSKDTQLHGWAMNY